MTFEVLMVKCLASEARINTTVDVVVSILTNLLFQEDLDAHALRSLADESAWLTKQLHVLVVLAWEDLG